MCASTQMKIERHVRDISSFVTFISGKPQKALIIKLILLFKLVYTKREDISKI